MFSKFTGGAQQTPSTSNKDNGTLDSVLPDQQAKMELVVLLMLCTDQMRRDIDAVFDPSITSSASPAAVPPSPWEDEQDPLNGPPTYRQATRDLGHDYYIRRKRELGSPQVRELHRDAVQAFARWRVQVLKRAGEVLKVRADAAKTEKMRRDSMVISGSGPSDSGPSESQRSDLIDLDDEHKQSYDGGDEQRYGKVTTTLADLDRDKRVIVLNSLLLLLLSLENYSAYSRVLLLCVTSSLNLPSTLVTEQEDTVAHGLLKGAKAQMDAEASRKRENNKDATGRAWKVGLATVAGAAVIGLTGGLAAPFLAGAIGTVLGGVGLGGTAIAGLLGTLAGNFVVIGTLFGAYGGSMTGKMMDKYAKEVEDFSFIPLRRVDEDKHRLRVTIGISGWLQTKEDRYLPWLVLGDRIESFCLQWELETLLQLGGSLMQTFRELAVRYAAIEIIKRTVFAGLLVALWPLGLLKMGKMLSNSFSVAQVRADKAGEVLADALIHKAQGERPVILIGYSLGARVIYSCLQTLAKRRAFGLVESVVLMGLPASAESHNWRPLRAVVADRVVNAYSRNDYILGLVYRTSSITPDVAGLQPVGEVAGIENVDVSELVGGHMRYRYLVGAILKKIGYETLDQEQLEREHMAFEKLEAQEEQLKREQQAKERARRGKQDESQAQNLDWDVVFDGSQDAQALDDKEMEEKLRALKIKERDEQHSKNGASALFSAQEPGDSKLDSEPRTHDELPPALPARPSLSMKKAQSDFAPNLPVNEGALRSSANQESHVEQTGVPVNLPEPEISAQLRPQVDPSRTLHSEPAMSEVEDDDEFAGHRITMIDDE